MDATTHTTDPIAALLAVTPQQVEARLDAIDSEQVVLRRMLRALREREKIERICAERTRRQQGGSA